MSSSTDTASAAPAPEESGGKYPGKGFHIGEYVITDFLGHGSMASVFLAADGTGHEVALKIFQEGPGVSATMLERFRREAEASKKLRRHPNIMPIYTTGRDGPYHYIVMESVRNSRTLEAALESTPMSLMRVVEIIIRIARALQYAHTHNIVHRDVKPTNIMIDEFEEPLLSDFRVAELMDWPSCTLTGALTGTPLYMSPEQARGERVGPASDIYSLGVVLYEAVTGVLPYAIQHGSPVKEVLEAVKNELPRRPRLFRKEIPPDLEAVLFKALEKEPRDRYVDAEAFAGDLERVRAGRPVSAHRFSILAYLRHLTRRYRRAILAGAAMLAVLSGAGLLFRQRLLRIRFEELWRRAQLKNALYMLAEAENGAGFERETPRAWNDIRLARKAMIGGAWGTARDGFRAAADISRSVGDTRTSAIAELDQARCEIMLNNRQGAQALYHRILTNPDASPAVANMAQLEYIEMALLEGNRERALEVLMLHTPPPEGPIRISMKGLAGDLSSRDVANAVENMQHPFRNDAYVAAAIRAYLDGEGRLAAGYLKRAIQASSPPSEWPAPFARLLYADLGR
ncbi:MAG: serine/threonine protein kinase [Verrucomicrobia bacterium]|nr:serine/threonine protein kinase [Verrucomicrobiota bacterium]